MCHVIHHSVFEGGQWWLTFFSRYGQLTLAWRQTVNGNLSESTFVMLLPKYHSLKTSLYPFVFDCQRAGYYCKILHGPKSNWHPHPSDLESCLQQSQSQCYAIMICTYLIILCTDVIMLFTSEITVAHKSSPCKHACHVLGFVCKSASLVLM